MTTRDPSEGLTPPAQLRKSRPSYLATTSMGSTDPQTESRPQHTRSASFFSFHSKRSAQQQAQQATIQVANQRSPTGSTGHMQTPSVPPAEPKRPSLDVLSMNSNPAVQREIRSVVDLALAHAHKIYYSGPLVRRMERLPDGNRPVRDEGWVEVFAQLGGTTLSVWDQKAIDEASKRGEEVPPSYINVTDSYIQVLGALTSPATATAPAKRYTNVITINTAGSNLIFFACPSASALVSWAASLRLASWEKSRLEEIYTGHLLRMSLSENDTWKEPASTLVKGKLEGEVKVRIGGQTDWKPLWMVLSSATDDNTAAHRPTSPLSHRSKNRMSNLFARGQASSTGPTVSVISFYQSKSKDRKKPLLTVRHVTQAVAVYPERLEVIQKSTLIKIEGLLGEEDLGGSMKGKESWLMLMPETQHALPVFELLKWLVATHDAFSLYGRPARYNWDPRHPKSMWFGYPIGPQRGQLFVDREMAEKLDPRDDRTAAIRRELQQILITKMQVSPISPSPSQVGQLQRQGIESTQNTVQRSTSLTAGSAISSPSPQLPPLGFNGSQDQPIQILSEPQQIPSGRSFSPLSPITERSHAETLSPKSPLRSRTAEPSLNMVVGPMSAPQGSASDNVGGSQVSNPTPTLEDSASNSFLGESSVSNQTPKREDSASSSFLGRPQVSNPMPEPQSSTSSNFLGGPLVTSPTAESHSAPHRNGDSPVSTPASKSDSKLAEYVAYASIGFDKPDTNRPQSDKVPPSAKSPVTRKSPPVSLHSPTQSASLTSSVLPPPKALSRVSPISPLSGSGSQSPAGSLHSPRVASSEPSQMRQSSPPNQAATSPASAKPHTPRPPSPPPKEHGPPISTNRAFPQAPPVTDASSLTPSSANINDLANEAGALYLLRQQAEEAQRPPGTWTTDEDDDEEEEDEDHDSDFTGPEPNPPPRRATPPVRIQPPSAYRRSDVMSENYGSNRSIGRKPSGARAKPSSRRYTDHSPSNLSSSFQSPVSVHAMEQQQSHPVGYDDNADALAALTFLETHEEPAPPPERTPATSPHGESSPQPSETHHYPSTFAPSKQATERKAKAQALQEASYAATHLPGKPNGNIKKREKDQGAWAESSDEEEEDEDEDEDEDGSDDERPTTQLRQPQPVPASDPRASVYPSAQPGPQGPPSMAGDGHAQRQIRTLPLPPSKTGDHQDHHQNHPRVASSQYDDRPRTHVGDEPRGHTMNPHLVARQSVWSTVLDPNPRPRNTTGKDTFVQVEDSETMTKAFQPQGLLSAGLQDKEDRSAKRQEELARETGASLINVPNKPPPPQTGLLGAITAHERDRKREGGVGATLTEKERERRLAEERQRKLDELQRQQLDQMSQGGGQGAFDAYGQQSFPGFAPGFDPRMSMNPMMLNPYMAGGFPMMPFGNPQQLMAAQMAAQQAYQQAMMTFSQAGGSQMGENMSPVGAPPAGASPQMGSSPMQGGMMGMDPRMSMGMNPWMGGGMGMGMGMNPMGGGMGMAPMGMVDPRMSMGQQNYFQRPDSRQGHGSPYQGGPFQGTPSPRQGSPALRSSNNNSPRPQPQP